MNPQDCFVRVSAFVALAAAVLLAPALSVPARAQLLISGRRAAPVASSPSMGSSQPAGAPTWSQRPAPPRQDSPPPVTYHAPVVQQQSPGYSFTPTRTYRMTQPSAQSGGTPVFDNGPIYNRG